STYISTVLHDLAEEDVPKFQLDSIMRMALKKHLIVEPKCKQVERLIDHPSDEAEYKVKTSYKFLKDLLKYCEEKYIKNFKCNDFEVLNVNISGDKITNLFHNKYKDKEMFVRIKWICENIFDIHFYREKRPDKINAIKQQIFLNIYKCIKDKNAPKSYMEFLKQYGLKLTLNGNMVKNEDVYPIFIIRSFIYGADKFPKIKHIVIDEMQDYSPVQFYVINYLFNCPKTILGDYSQSLSPKDVKANYKYIKDILNDDITYVTINKSYRPTKDIADLYNYIGNVKDAVVVDRKGKTPELIKCKDIANSDKKILSLIDEAKSNGYKSIAVVTKTSKMAAELYGRLKSKINELNLIDDNTDGYKNEVCVISAFNSKGLEFDYVIVYNVSEEEYVTDIDNNLLYIACSRALHDLKLVSIGTPNKKIEKYFKGLV
ncbi:MAG: ATP-binding domain-containing protein, partial [Clostridia bacterium]|nr:ATP-binding domain-containing protein [Clostridia bacterium]